MAGARQIIQDNLSRFFTEDFFGEKLVYNGEIVNGILRVVADPTSVGQRSSGTAVSGTLQILVEDVPLWFRDDLVIDASGQRWKVKKQLEGSTTYKHVLHVERDRRLRP